MADGTRVRNLGQLATAEFVVAYSAADGLPNAGILPIARLQTLISGLTGPSYETFAELDADDAWPEGALGYVFGDGNEALRGVYAYQSGSWVRLGPLPATTSDFIFAVNAGDGSANAIIATSVKSIPVDDRAALIALPITDDNTATGVTVAFNGGAALPVKTAAGNDPPIGGLVDGMVVFGVKQSGTFTLLTDLATAAHVLAAEEAEAAAAGSASAAAGSASAAATSASNASASEDQASIAAIAAGAPIVTALTDPVPANGTIEILQTDAGAQVYEVQSDAWVAIGWLGEVLFDDVAALLASTLTGFAEGHIIRTRKEGLAYEVAPTAASTHHVTNAGGEKFFVLSRGKEYNALAFGAIAGGLGGVDNADALQKAVGACAASPFVKTLYIPGGSYRCDGNIMGASDTNVTVYGNRGVTILTSQTGNRQFFNAYNGVTIRDIVLHGNRGELLGGASQAAIRIRGNDVLVENVWIDGAYGDGIYFQASAASDRVKIENCYITDAGRQGIAAVGMRRLRLINNVVVGGVYSGFNIEVQAAEFGPFDEVVCIGNIAISCPQAGFYISAPNTDDYSNIIISANTTISCDVGFRIGRIRNANITGNIGVGGSIGIRLAECKFPQVVGNTLRDFDQYGIEVRDTDDALIGPNQLYDLCDGEETDRGGIYVVSCNRPRIFGNKLRNIGAAGVRFRSGVGSGEIRDNEIRNATTGVLSQLTCASPNIDGNDVRDCGEAYNISANSSPLTFTNNKARDCTTKGCTIRSAIVTAFDNNTFYSCAGTPSVDVSFLTRVSAKNNTVDRGALTAGRVQFANIGKVILIGNDFSEAGTTEKLRISNIDVFHALTTHCGDDVDFATNFNDLGGGTPGTRLIRACIGMVDPDPE